MYTLTNDGACADHWGSPFFKIRFRLTWLGFPGSGSLSHLPIFIFLKYLLLSSHHRRKSEVALRALMISSVVTACDQFDVSGQSDIQCFALLFLCVFCLLAVFLDGAIEKKLMCDFICCYLWLLAFAMCCSS